MAQKYSEYVLPALNYTLLTQFWHSFFTFWHGF